MAHTHTEAEVVRNTACGVGKTPSCTLRVDPPHYHILSFSSWLTEAKVDTSVARESKVALFLSPEGDSCGITKLPAWGTLVYTCGAPRRR